MTVIFENLISLLIFAPINIILAYAILWLANPLGFFITFLSLIYAINSNTEGKNMENIKKIFTYLKDYKQRDVSLISPQWTALTKYDEQTNIIKENKWTQQFLQIYYFLRSVFL